MFEMSTNCYSCTHTRKRELAFAATVSCCTVSQMATENLIFRNSQRSKSFGIISDDFTGVKTLYQTCFISAWFFTDFNGFHFKWSFTKPLFFRLAHREQLSL